jgi:hypothetical protein
MSFRRRTPERDPRCDECGRPITDDDYGLGLGRLPLHPHCTVAWLANQACTTPEDVAAALGISRIHAAQLMARGGAKRRRRSALPLV